MNLTNLSLRYPAAVAVIFTLLLLFGAIAFNKLPIQLLPTTETPQISIMTFWRAAAPEEVEEQIVQPQEEVLRNIEGLRTITSNSRRGMGQVALEFEIGTDLQAAMIDVITNINAIPPLPEDAIEPRVFKGGGNPFGAGIASMLLYPNEGNPVGDVANYQQLIDDVVEPRLARIKGVSRVNLMGEVPKDLLIEIDPQRMSALNVSVLDVSSSVRGATDVSGGFADVGRKRFTVRFIGKRQIDELSDLTVGWRQGQPVYLRDVATVGLAPADNQSFSLRNGFPAYYITLNQRADANSVEILDELNDVIAELNAGPLAENKLTLELSFDSSLHIRRAISMVQNNLMLGLLLAGFVLFFFLRDLRATLLVGLTIPFSVAASMIALQLSGLSLNVISLAGVAFSVGLVMDAAIIVQENVVRLKAEGRTTAQALQQGVAQVSGALFSSTVTSVAIFLPILFISGLEGQLFRDLAITLSVAVLCSFISAMTVLPLVARYGLSGEQRTDRLANLWSKLARISVWASTRVAARYAIVGVLVIGSALAAWRMMPKVDFLPKADIDAVATFLQVPPGMNIDTIEEEIATELVARLKPYYDRDKAPYIKGYNLSIFGGGGMVFIYPQHAEDTQAMADLMRDEILKDIPGLRGFPRIASMLNIDNGGGRGIQVDLQGPNLEMLMQAATVGMQKIRGLWPNTSVFPQPSLQFNEPQLLVTPNDYQISQSGASRYLVSSTIRAYTSGLWAGEYFDGNRKYNTIIRSPQWQSPEQLADLPVATPRGGAQKLGQLVGMHQQVGPSDLFRVNGLRTITLNVAPPEGVTLEEAMERISVEAAPDIRAALPEGGSISYRGNADRLAKALDTVSVNFALAILILVLILAAMFVSLRDALIVVAVMPMAAVGGLSALAILNWVTYQSLDMLTMIGFFILLGLVVNNAILVVDQTNRALADGRALRDAIEYAIKVRARPIFMSTLTSIFGMLPLLLVPGVGSEIYRGLAAVIIGGMTLSAALTLLLMPALLQLPWLKPLPNAKSAPIQEVAV